MRTLTEWSPEFIVSEVDLLNRVLLAKARLVLAARETRYFQETPISPDSARELFRLAEINPYDTRSVFTNDAQALKKKHQARFEVFENGRWSQIYGTNESTTTEGQT